MRVRSGGVRAPRPYEVFTVVPSKIRWMLWRHSR
nr:MAG TPA_asm: hypothetical protein [Caudoviricetes sp.]